MPLVISANCSNATVVLNGSLSHDPDGDSLQYFWHWTGGPDPLATGVIAVVTLPVGTNVITLEVNDGLATNEQTITVLVLTPAQAVARLVALVKAGVSRNQDLIASLNAALASIHRGNLTAAINQLQAFQNKVRAQITPLDAALAQTLIADAQNIINAISQTCGSKASCINATCQTNHKIHLHFSGQQQQVYLIQKSTDLVTWKTTGVANDLDDGTFDFTDSVSMTNAGCFYRVVIP